MSDRGKCQAINQRNPSHVVCFFKDPIIIGIWNVRTSFKSGRLEELKYHMREKQMSIQEYTKQGGVRMTIYRVMIYE